MKEKKKNQVHIKEKLKQIIHTPFHVHKMNDTKKK